MAAQWPQQYQQQQSQNYGPGPYQQYPQQQPHLQYGCGQQQAGQTYAHQPYAQQPPAQQQGHQQQFYQQPPYQQTPVTSSAAPQQTQWASAQAQQSPQMQQYAVATQQQQQATSQPYSAPIQAPTPVQAVQPQQPNHNCCFNCGSTDHWAQSCPQPKKQSGPPDRQNSTPSNKDKKFKAPVVTKYAVPPHVAQAQAMQQQAASQAWAPPGYGHYGYSQYPAQHQMAYAPPNPVSAQYPSNGQWPQTPQYSQYPQYQPGSQAGYAPQQAGSYQQYPYAPTPQTPVQPYSPYLQSKMSPTGSQGTPVQFQQPQGGQAQVAQVPPQSSASPHSATSVAIAYQPQPPQNQRYSPTNTTQTYPPAAHPTPSHSSTPHQQPVQDVVEEPEEDDLKKLDIPDLPTAEGGTTVSLVGRPLPTNFVVADALAPFAPPALGDKGLCKSKYLEKADADIVLPNIKDTSDWNSHKKDPIFASLKDDDRVVTLKEIDAIYRPHQVDTEPSQAFGSRWDSERNDSYDTHNDDGLDIMNRLEDALRRPSNQPPSDDERARRYRKRDFPQSRTDDRYGRGTKESFHGRKTTDDPIRAKGSVRPFPPPTPQDRYDDHGYGFRSRSRSPRRYDSSPQQYISPPDSAFEDHGYNNRYSNPQRDHHYDQDPCRQWEDNYPQTFDPPPPPPPPPMRKPSWYDGPGGSPPSTDLPARDPFELDQEDCFQNSHAMYQNGNGLDTASISPVKLRSERSYPRQRESNRDDSSDENEAPARRQVDDVTPRLKRRQPKVAAAYSRR